MVRRIAGNVSSEPGLARPRPFRKAAARDQADGDARDQTVSLDASGRGALGRDLVQEGSFDRPKSLLKRSNGVPKIVSAR
jgi:hypothetical protein